MGILNLCPDSFSGDGVTDLDLALVRSRTMVEEGAEIIDIGAESARTNREAISEAEESDRLCEFIRRWKSEGLPAWLSVNTWRPQVVREALSEGGEILNDIGALPDDANIRACKETGAALLVMHSIGAPKKPHTHVSYPDIMAELDRFFEAKLQMCDSLAFPRESIILDPGIDFAKQREDNLRIYKELRRLTAFERPILLPVSRKTVIGQTLGIDDPARRDAGTVACIVQGMLNGASLFRVHNVRAAVQAIEMISALETKGGG